jgi:branched-chain amino acid transport system substrate-binding protein
MVRGRRIPVLVLAALALVVASCGRDSDDGGGTNTGGSADPGITDTSIKLGGSIPNSGPASAYAAIAKSIQGYFKMVNEAGGVNGRKVEWITYDDGYDPAKAVTNARKLVEQDKVFALFNTLGTANNVAIWDYTNQKKVPQLFVATGATVFGADIAKHPWTIGWQPSYRSEATVYAEYLKKSKPNAKVAILAQNDGFGEDLTGAFKKGIEGSSVKIVSEQTYEVTDPSVGPQVKKLAASGADTFLDITTPKFGAQAIAAVAQSGWKPLHILNAVAASKTQVLKPVGFKISQGIVTAAYIKAADDPMFANDPAVVEFKKNIAKYAPDADPNDPFSTYGWSVGYTMVETLKAMKSPTRAAVMDAARHLNHTPPLFLPGIDVKTDGDTDTFPVEALQVAQFEGEGFKLVGDVVNTSAD